MPFSSNSIPARPSHNRKSARHRDLRRRAGRTTHRAASAPTHPADPRPAASDWPRSRRSGATADWRPERTAGGTSDAGPSSARRILSRAAAQKRARARAGDMPIPLRVRPMRQPKDPGRARSQLLIRRKRATTIAFRMTRRATIATLVLVAVATIVAWRMTVRPHRRSSVELKQQSRLDRRRRRLLRTRQERLRQRLNPTHPTGQTRSRTRRPAVAISAWTKPGAVTHWLAMSAGATRICVPDCSRSPESPRHRPGPTGRRPNALSAPSSAANGTASRSGPLAAGRARISRSTTRDVPVPAIGRTLRRGQSCGRVVHRRRRGAALGQRSSRVLRADVVSGDSPVMDEPAARSEDPPVAVVPDDYPQVEVFLRGYLHQDFLEDFTTARDARDAFAGEASPAATRDVSPVNAMRWAPCSPGCPSKRRGNCWSMRSVRRGGRQTRTSSNPCSHPPRTSSRSGRQLHIPSRITHGHLRLHQGRAASTSSNGPTTRATRCPTGSRTRTRRSRTARS